MQLLAFGKREEIPSSSHVCQLYTRADEIAHIAAGLFSAGPFPHRDLCVYVGPPTIIVQLESQLRQLQVDVEALKRAGQFVFVDDRTEYLSQNRFDHFSLLSSHLNLVNAALRDDFVGVRLAMEMTWLADNVATPAQILKYEAMCDAVFTFQRQPIVAIAQYNSTRLGEQITGEMNKLHPIAYVGRQLKRNPSYLNSEQYFLNILRATRKANDR
ncbi:MAG TPA: MEDS domain-containing protein [Chloroflexota bacterium]